MTDNVDTTSTTGARFIGRVKWFNNKAGYGFITVTDGPQAGSDMFVHHSAIAVASQQYKYLVQGEYVELNVVKAQGGTHEYQAVDVAGIKGGKLMCETRFDFKLARNSYQTTNEKDAESMNVPKQRAPRVRGEGPRDSEKQRPSGVSSEGPKDCCEKKEWTVVGKGANTVKTTPSGRGRGRPPRTTNTAE
jgi:CspA family cold shock protein